MCVCSNTVDDEEEMLYGDSSAGMSAVREEIARNSSGAGPFGSDGGSMRAEPTHWCIIIRENGVMEVWQTTS